MTNTLQKIIHNGDEYLLPEGFSPDNAGTTDDVLTKTANGYEWQNVPATGLQESPNSTITGIKYIRHGTEADYANLSQYYTDTPGDTEFHCF